MSFHGNPCWFELGTSDVDAAEAFYGTVLGWLVGDSAMPGFDYRLAKAGDAVVAGLMPLAAQPDGTPPNWLIYFAVNSVDDVAHDAESSGARVVKAPDDVPGTGRFAVLADPQGAVFGILQPLPMETMPESGAFDQMKEGHGNWIELMTSNPAAALDFYAGRLGWTRSEAMDMGEHGTYQLFAHDGCDIGGMMRQGEAPSPAWLPYFGVNGIDDAIRRVDDGGGTVRHGPIEVPGGAFVAMCTDPQGAAFAMVGPRIQTS